MKKYLFLAIALLGMASCAKDDLADGNKPIHSREVEESYIAINLSAADITRADGDDGYLDGTNIERQVETAHFFFFKDGAAFPVNVADGAVTEPGSVSNVNYLAANLNLGPNTGSAPNVSDIKNVVLLLKNYKGEYPNQIVAVLNWSPVGRAYSLAELHAAVVGLNGPSNDDGYFVMSNSVYLAGNNIMDYTPLTVDNIGKTQDEAEDRPVQIYVERVAAKVTVTTADGSARFKLAPEGSTSGTGVVTLGGQPTPVYANILGWELHLDNSQSYLLKHISDTWTDINLGFPWNNSPYYRSYWATSLAAPSGNGESFRMSYTDEQKTANGFANNFGYNVGNNSTVLAGTFTDGSYTYVGENTTYVPGTPAVDGNPAVPAVNTNTKIILKARLENEAGTALEIASWMGQQYVGNDALRTVIANSLKYTLFYKEGNNYIGIKPEDLVCVAGGNGDYKDIIDDNNTYVQLSEDGLAKEWYKLENGVYKPVATDVNTDARSIAATNEYLATKVQPSVLYANGETFYYIDIRHLGATIQDPGYYGIVRNHIYNVTVNKIGGYGSPVYVGYSNLVVPEYPEDPTQEGSFVSAKVNILAWRLVNQTVDIQPNN